MFLNLAQSSTTSIAELISKLDFSKHTNETVIIEENKILIIGNDTDISASSMSECSINLVEGYGLHVRMTIHSKYIKRNDNLFSEVYKFLVVRKETVTVFSYTGTGNWETLIHKTYLGR